MWTMKDAGSHAPYLPSPALALFGCLLMIGFWTIIAIQTSGAIVNGVSGPERLFCILALAFSVVQIADCAGIGRRVWRRMRDSL